MYTRKKPLPKTVKWSALSTLIFSVAYALLALPTGECAPAPNPTLFIKGGSSYVCVGSSFEEKCYKLSELDTRRAKYTAAPQ